MDSVRNISDLYPNLFTPAGFTFAIWGLIYLLLGIFVGYQVVNLLNPNTKKMPLTAAIGLLFFASSILNAAWIFAWHHLQISLSLFIHVLSPTNPDCDIQKVG